MIKDRHKLEGFERKLLKEENLSFRQANAIFEGLRREAVSLGAFSCENILDGLDVDVRILKAINGLRS